MLSEAWWMHFEQDILIEWTQLKEEGMDVADFESKVKEIAAMENSNPNKKLEAEALYEEMKKAPMLSNYPYLEPSDLEGIKAARPVGLRKLEYSFGKEELYNKIYGAWLGRVVGCLLGKPIEGWKRERLMGLLKETGNYPLTNYISSDIEASIKEKYEIEDTKRGNTVMWINNIHGIAPIDDDTNYTVLGLVIVDKYGKNFTPADVAEAWLTRLPIFSTCTAERVAYRNCCLNIYPPFSATFKNPFREWIGAQIRGDFFGYVNPADPEKAAEFAWRDASISHTKNGIYGEMFMAAMIAAASVYTNIDDIIEAGLNEIPQNCRLTEKIKEVQNWYKSGLSYEDAVDKIHSIYNEFNAHDWCHTISNAMIVCLGLLYGEKDFEKSITMSVMPCFDTDCNGATVGSIIGILLGADKIPTKWTEVFNDTLKTSIMDYEKVNLSDMAKKTMELIDRK